MARYPSKRRRDFHNNYRETNSSCPYCLSIMVLSNSGHWVCSGDKLRFWEEKFDKYSKLSEIKQIEFLTQFNNIDNFLTLYNKWNYMDKDGSRSNFNCEYSNYIGSPMITTTLTMPDPLMVKSIERSLGRGLTEEELRGEQVLWVKGHNYYSTFKKGRTKVAITTIQFPDDM